jgi:hypothetical protein
MSIININLPDDIDNKLHIKVEGDWEQNTWLSETINQAIDV